MNKIGVFSIAEDGHRAAYIAYSKKIMAADRIDKAQLLSWPGLVFFLMVEESFILYASTAILRSLCGRRTAGLLFRPMPCIGKSTLKLQFKYCALRTLKRTSSVSTLTIVPFDVEPRFAEIASGALPDFQLWDINPNDLSHRARRNQSINETASSVRRAAGGRKILIALGGQDRNKGFDVFANLYINHPDIRKDWLFVYAGKTAAGLGELSASFQEAGGYAKDLVVSDTVLADMYDVADLIWGFYSIDYDQASGIIGRAIQLGVPVLVRSGSLMDKLCAMVDAPAVRSAVADLPSLLVNNPIPAGNRSQGIVARNYFEHEALRVLQDLMGDPANP